MGAKLMDRNKKIFCECGNDTFVAYVNPLISGTKLVCTKCNAEKVEGRIRKY
jgi:hypothetical protein